MNDKQAKRARRLVRGMVKFKIIHSDDYADAFYRHVKANGMPPTMADAIEAYQRLYKELSEL